MITIMDEILRCILSILKQIIDILHAIITSLLSFFRNTNSNSNSNFSFFNFQRSKTITFIDSGINATIDTKIAEGGFSYIYSAHDVQSPTVKYALKRIMCPDEETIQLCQNEAKIHRILDHHVNAMTLLGMKFELDSNSSSSNASSGQVCYMLFPLITGGSLRDEITKRRLLQYGDTHYSHHHHNHNRDPQYFTTIDILTIFHGVLKAVKAMHDAGYAHCDIKLENVMLDQSNSNSSSSYVDEEMGSGITMTNSNSTTSSSNGNSSHNLGTPVLMDFGSARPLVIQLRDRKTVLNLTEQASQNSTVSYRAPELFDGGCRHGPDEPNVDGKVDVWSCGCLLYALMYGTSPFEMEFRHDGTIRIVECTHLRVLGGNIPFPQTDVMEASYGYRKELKDLVQWILVVDRKHRPDLDSLLMKVEKLVSSSSTTSIASTTTTAAAGNMSSFDGGVTRRAIV